MTARRLSCCRGSHAPAGASNGAHWTNFARCPVCGKRIAITKTGHLRTHGTYPAAPPATAK